MNAEPPDRTHPDVLTACEDARVLPDRLWFLAPTEERTVARRMVACRLAHAGWRPGRIAALFGVTLRCVEYWLHRCPVRFQVGAWRPPAGLHDATEGRKWRRCRS